MTDLPEISDVNFYEAVVLVEGFRAKVRDMRIAIAQRRDDRLTEVELMAKLAVYNEFGR